jgi:hypothetical protein
MDKQFHVGQAKSHIAIAKCHEELAKFHGLIADAEKHKSVDGIRNDCHQSISECHKEVSAHHADLADQHIKAAKAIESGKSMDTESDGTDASKVKGGRSEFAMRDFSKAEPTSVHGALPDIPSGQRLVGRPGGPPIETSEDPTAAIDAFK